MSSEIKNGERCVKCGDGDGVYKSGVFEGLCKRRGCICKCEFPKSLPEQEQDVIADTQHLIAFEHYGAWRMDDRTQRWYCIAGCGGYPAVGHREKCSIALLCRSIQKLIDTRADSKANEVGEYARTDGVIKLREEDQDSGSMK